MAIVTDSFVSWEEEVFPADDNLPGSDSIATEADHPDPSAWEACIDALLQVMTEPPTQDDGPSPTAAAIKTALGWLAPLRQRFPEHPPTCVMREPGGGLIVEWQSHLDGNELLSELTFYNDGTVEQTEYINGKIQEMLPLPQRPNYAAVRRR